MNDGRKGRRVDYPEDNVRRNDASGVEDDRNGSKCRCVSLLTCCFKIGYDEYEDSALRCETNECEYVVEKLLVKRVPLTLFAIPQDYEADEAYVRRSGILYPTDFPSDAKRVQTPQSNVKTVHRRAETVGSNLAQTSSGKKIRLNDGNDLDDGEVDASLSGKKPKWQRKEAAILSGLGTFRPDLKESERSPEEPKRPNRNQIPVAENMTEPRRNIPIGESVNMAEGKYAARIDKLHETDPYASSSSNDPTRSKFKLIERKQTNRNGSRWFRNKPSKSANEESAESEEASKNLHNSTLNSDKRSIRSGPRQEMNTQRLIVAPIQLNWNFNEVDKTRMEAAKFEGFRENSDSLDVQNSARSMEESLIDEASNSTEETNGINGATLRWRITIKHRQLDASLGESIKMCPVIDALKFKRGDGVEDH